MPHDPTAALFRDPDALRLQRLAVDIARAARLLADDAADAAEVQWAPSPIPRPRDDTTERSKGGHGDPTPSVAFDARRMEVREAVTGALAALALTTTALEAARGRLAPALARWAGETSDV